VRVDQALAAAGRSVRAPSERVAADSPRAVARPQPSEPAVTRRGAWRDQLCAWAEATLAAPGGAAELPSETPVGQLADRLALGPGATRGLALLYAIWLLGRAEEGLPAATVAAVVGSEAELGADGQGWLEAFGRGQLAPLVLYRRGRTRLRRRVAHFLDGEPVRVKVVSGASDPVEPLDATSVVSVSGAEAAEIGDALARHFGRDLALVELGEPDRRTVAALLLEARLVGAVPVLLGARDFELWGDLLDGQLALIAVDGPCPESLQHLPQLTLA
jgi:hypothetical protein